MEFDLEFDLLKVIDPYSGMALLGLPMILSHASVSLAYEIERSLLQARRALSRTGVL